MKKIILKINIINILLIPKLVFAQLDLGELDPVPWTSFGGLVQNIAIKIIPVAFALSVIMIIYAGFLFVSAGGSEEKVRKAKHTLYWAIIGAVILLGAWAIAAGFVDIIISL